jgi:hypothetical protein
LRLDRPYFVAFLARAPSGYALRKAPCLGRPILEKISKPNFEMTSAKLRDKVFKIKADFMAVQECIGLTFDLKYALTGVKKGDPLKYYPRHRV